MADEKNVFKPAKTQDEAVGNETAPHLNTLNILGERAGKSAQRATAAQKDGQDEYVGTATMLADKTIVLHLRAKAQGVVGETEFRYKPGDSHYSEILKHLDGLEPGQNKLVKPWPDDPEPKTQVKPKDKKSGFDLPDILHPLEGILPDSKLADSLTPVPGLPADMPVVQRIGASDAFVQQVEKTIEALPQNVRMLLKDNGATVIATGTVTEALPDLAGQHPRGWPPGATWDNCDGAQEPGKKLIVVSEHRKDGNTTLPNHNVEGVTRHETGHAVDHLLKDFSDSKEFKDAYAKDVSAMPQDVKLKLEYFLQKDEAGHEEAFAEIFATINGGASDNFYTPLIQKYFPNTIQVVNDRLAKV